MMHTHTPSCAVRSFPMSEEALSSDFEIPFGKVKIEREGTDVTIVTFSKMVGFALEAAEKLATEGISCEVVNLRSIRPLDRDGIIKVGARTRGLQTHPVLDRMPLVPLNRSRDHVCRLPPPVSLRPHTVGEKDQPTHHTRGRMAAKRRWRGDLCPDDGE